MSLPVFNNPPINEVIAGVFFEPLKEFNIPHYGLFWNGIKEEYPHCEHADPLLRKNPANDKPWLLPRVWLLNKEKTSLIQIQNDCFLFNWRRVTGGEDYPRFSIVFKEFQKQLNGFRSFLAGENLPELAVQECELSYINHIPCGEVWQNPVEIGRFLPDLKWGEQKRFLPPFDAAAWSATFALPDDFGRLAIGVKHGKKLTDGMPIYILQFSAKGLGGDGDDARIGEWFELAHEWIVSAFCDITDKTIQQEVWKRGDR